MEINPIRMVERVKLSPIFEIRFFITVIDIIFLQTGPQDNWVMTPDERARILNVVMIIGIALALIYVFFKVKHQRNQEKKKALYQQKRTPLKKSKARPAEIKVDKQWYYLGEGTEQLRIHVDEATESHWFIDEISASSETPEMYWNRIITAIVRKAIRKEIRELNFVNLMDQVPKSVLSFSGFRIKIPTPKQQEKGITNWLILEIKEFKKQEARK
jgi:flagellar biogenesis protein FliO